jgi:radical SAM superfamily enzyme
MSFTTSSFDNARYWFGCPNQADEKHMLGCIATGLQLQADALKNALANIENQLHDIRNQLGNPQLTGMASNTILRR